MRAIYRMSFDCGRGGTLSGIFTADKDKLTNLIGTELYFGEVLGKHSEVYGPLEESEITLITDDPVAVDLFDKYEMETGYNPFDYVLDDSDDED